MSPLAKVLPTMNVRSFGSTAGLTAVTDLGTLSRITRDARFDTESALHLLRVQFRHLQSQLDRGTRKMVAIFDWWKRTHRA